MRYIHHIEVSGICNMKCSYCPHPTSKRKKGLMTEETFIKCMKLVKKTGQKDARLYAFGEPLLHPELLRFIRIAREYVDEVELSTNGVYLTRRMAIDLKEAGVTYLVISAHDKEIQKWAVKNCKGLKILKYVRKRFYHTWAGQTEKGKGLYLENIISKVTDLFKRDINQRECIFQLNRCVTIYWDGRITSCFMDSEGFGVIGSVYDARVIDLNPEYMEICKKCHWFK
jgi:hypothetical protein